jgi:hypothetical protein
MISDARVRADRIVSEAHTAAGRIAGATVTQARAALHQTMASMTHMQGLLDMPVSGQRPLPELGKRLDMMRPLLRRFTQSHSMCELAQGDGWMRIWSLPALRDHAEDPPLPCVILEAGDAVSDKQVRRRSRLAQDELELAGKRHEIVLVMLDCCEAREATGDVADADEYRQAWHDVEG